MQGRIEQLCNNGCAVSFLGNISRITSKGEQWAVCSRFGGENSKLGKVIQTGNCTWEAFASGPTIHNIKIQEIQIMFLHSPQSLTSWSNKEESEFLQLRKTQSTAGPAWTMESQQIVSAGGRYQSGISATQPGYVTLCHGTRVDQKLNLMFSPHLQVWNHQQCWKN